MEKQRALSPEIFSAIQLSDIADLLEDMKNLLGQLIPEGLVKQLKVAVGAQITELNAPNTYPNALPWARFQIFNDGPDPVFFVVNFNYIPVGTVPLNPNETVPVEMTRDQIKNIILSTLTQGNIANVRIFAVK